MPVLQPIRYTFGTLKYTQNLANINISVCLNISVMSCIAIMYLYLVIIKVMMSVMDLQGINQFQLSVMVSD